MTEKITDLPFVRLKQLLLSDWRHTLGPLKLKASQTWFDGQLSKIVEIENLSSM